MFRPVMGCMTMVLWTGVALMLALIISSVFCDAVSTCFGLFCYCFVLLTVSKELKQLIVVGFP
jgi:hypothetical protein